MLSGGSYKTEHGGWMPFYDVSRDVELPDETEAPMRLSSCRPTADEVNRWLASGPRLAWSDEHQANEKYQRTQDEVWGRTSRPPTHDEVLLAMDAARIEREEAAICEANAEADAKRAKRLAEYDWAAERKVWERITRERIAWYRMHGPRRTP